MEDKDYSLMKMHVHNGAQRRSDGADAYVENLRYDYLEGKDKVSFAEGTGIRHVTESGAGSTRYERNPPKAANV